MGTRGRREGLRHQESCLRGRDSESGEVGAQSSLALTARAQGKAAGTGLQRKPLPTTFPVTLALPLCICCRMGSVIAAGTSALRSPHAMATCFLALHLPWQSGCF